MTLGGAGSPGWPLTPAPTCPDAVALVDRHGSVTHGELAAAVRQRAAQLPSAGGRRLVHIPLVAERGAVIAYLAVLAAGQVALVTAPTGTADILQRYSPDVRLGPDDEWLITARPQHLLHPDLALLLSTSGSTGSPKLVRLSATNVRSNADAIVAALGLRPEDRAITSLPLHYCFGLSVLHTHLRVGASVVLHPGAVSEPDFAAELAGHQVSTLAVTPHLLELLQVQGLLQRQLPDLRLIAQAGGALAPARVAELARLGRRKGWGLAVMYGQTEATARMAVLPPELAEGSPDAVGWPVADSSFRIDRSAFPADASRGPAEIGELVFSGPGVMMGYAEHRDELALPRMITELRTGDLGTIDADGLVHVAGRISGFVKIMGIRVDLGRVERSLAEAGITACVTGDDAAVRVCFEQTGGDPDPAHVRRLVSEAAGIGASCIQVRSVPRLPLLPSGKVDRQACSTGYAPAEVEAGASEPAAADLGQLNAALAPVLGRTTLDPDRSFAESGGDSFSHVQASIRMTRLLPDGHPLPPDWHHWRLRDLAALVETRRTYQRRRVHRTQIETTALLRAVAVVMICGSHVGLFPLAGGAHILLAVAGFHYARYIATVPRSGDRWRRTARAAIGIAIPSVLVAGGMKILAGDGDWPRVLMLNWLLMPGKGNIFWFVECLLVLMVACTALLSLPAVHRIAGRYLWHIAMLLGAIALVPRYLVLIFSDGPVRGLPWTVAWLFLAGMAMAAAGTRRRRAVTVTLAVVATVAFFPNAERNLVIMLGLIMLGTLSSVPLPDPLARPVGVLAGASLYVYLIQFQIFTYSDVPVIEFTLAMGAGLAFWALAHPLVRRCQCLIRPHGGIPTAKGPTREPTNLPDRSRLSRHREPAGLQP